MYLSIKLHCLLSDVCYLIKIQEQGKLSFLIHDAGPPKHPGSAHHGEHTPEWVFRVWEL